MWTPHTSLLSAGNVDFVPGSIQSFVAGLGLGKYSHAASLWVFFAACGVTELAISFLICTPLERFWPLTSWAKRNSIAADVAYAFFVRIVLFPLIAYFEFNWLRQSLDGFLACPCHYPSIASGPAPSAGYRCRQLSSSPTLPFSISPTIGVTASLTGLAGGMGSTHCIMPKSS